jgi:hypothetical protein
VNEHRRLEWEAFDGRCYDVDQHLIVPSRRNRSRCKRVGWPVPVLPWVRVSEHGLPANGGEVVIAHGGRWPIIFRPSVPVFFGAGSVDCEGYHIGVVGFPLTTVRNLYPPGLWIYTRAVTGPSNARYLGSTFILTVWVFIALNFLCDLVERDTCCGLPTPITPEECRQILDRPGVIQFRDCWDDAARP